MYFKNNPKLMVAKVEIIVLVHDTLKLVMSVVYFLLLIHVPGPWLPLLTVLIRVNGAD